MKTASKNVVDMYDELDELGFPARWIIPNRSFVVEGGTLRYTGSRFGRKTYLTKWLSGILRQERPAQTALNASVTKFRTKKTPGERKAALEMFLSEAPNYGLTTAWLVGSMAEGKENALSDIDLCIKGNFSLGQLYYLRDDVYLRTGVIIHLITNSPRGIKVKVYGS